MKDKTKVRDRFIVAGVTEKEYYEILVASSEMDLSISSFLRKAALDLARQQENK